MLVVSSSANECESEWVLVPRPHSVSVSEFGAIGDGITINTLAFQNAIFYLKSFADKGGAQLYIPPGRWLIGCITLTSHLTLFLEKDALILASQVHILIIVHILRPRLVANINTRDSAFDVVLCSIYVTFVG